MQLPLKLTALICLPILPFSLLIGCGSESGTAPVTASISGDGPDGSGGDAAKSPAGAASKKRIDTLHPVVEIHTTLGKIRVELDAERAPGTVRNFLNYVNAKFYDQTVFHFVAPDAFILGGGFTDQLEPRPTGEPIRNEAHNGMKNKRGTIAMSRLYESIDSATSQFFINVVDGPDLDFRDETPEGYGYCVFGKVVAGMDVVDQIAHVSVHDVGDFASTPSEPVVIQSIRLAP